MVVAIEQIDPTFAARKELSEKLNLPYVATLKQLDFHLAPERGMSQAVLYGGAMGGGKSAGLCAEAIRECTEVPHNRVLMARKESVTFKASTLTSLLELMPSYVVHRPSAQTFIFSNGSVLIYTGLGTEKEKQKLRSAEYGAIFIDEVTEIERPVFLEVSTRLRWKYAHHAGRLKLRCSCNPEPGWVKDSFWNPETKEPGYRFIAALPIDNPYLAPSYIHEMRRALPPELFRAYMLGDWDALLPQNTILSSELLNRAMRFTGYPGEPNVWGLDVARYGDDQTVLASRRGYQFAFLDRWRKQPVDETVSAVLTYYTTARHKPDAINIDDDGVGGGVTDGLVAASKLGALGACKVNAVVAQGQPPKSAQDRYGNMKAFLWFKLKEMLEAGAPVDLPPEPSALRADLEAHRFEVRGGKAFVEPKKLVKARLGRSPDDADAMVLTMYQGREDYVAYESAEDRLKRELDQLPEAQRALLLADFERRQRAAKRFDTFGRRFGLTTLAGGVEDEDDPYDLPY